MTTTINRRTALAGAAAGTLIPVGGLANSSMWMHSAAKPDPAVAAFHEWRESVLANNADPHDNDTPEGAPLWERYHAASEVMFDVVPTTPEGLACKARFIAEVCGELLIGGDPANPADFSYHKWASGEELRFINSLLAYAERLAGRAA